MESAVFAAITSIIQELEILGVGIICCIIIAEKAISTILGQIGGQCRLAFYIFFELGDEDIGVIGNEFFPLLRVQLCVLKLWIGGTKIPDAINHQKALAHREHVVAEEAEVILQRLRAAVAHGHQLIRDRSGEHFAANVVTQQAGEQQAEQAGQQHHGQHLGLHTQLAEEFDHHGGRKIGS